MTLATWRTNGAAGNYRTLLVMSKYVEINGRWLITPLRDMWQSRTQLLGLPQRDRLLAGYKFHNGNVEVVRVALKALAHLPSYSEHD
jgi:hypothetical protein